MIRDVQDLWRHEDYIRRIFSGGFHPCQPAETWVGAAGGGLAAVEFSADRFSVYS
jgi:hypothetical protein